MKSWLNFTGFPQQNVLNQNFSDTTIKSSEEQKETYFRIANYCKEWHTPVFSNDVVKFPESQVPIVAVELKEVIKETSPTKSESPDTSKELTLPPIKIEENTLINALLIGLGAALVYKILF
jgi:hypothetical protein